MRLLCAADLHLGRVPARLPAALAGEARAFGPYAAWEALVAACIRERPEALLLAGDVVDDPNDLFEAYGAMAHGVARVRAAGVRVVAVAGNHDLAVLPRLAREVDGLELLGADGVWERITLGHGAERTQLIGRSFPRDASGPVATGPELEAAIRAARAEGGPLIGLLHADLDGSDPRYAPVRRSELARFGLDAWLLGHVHVPRPPNGDPIGYLGSLTACDPGEEGWRGAWRATVRPGADPAVGLEPVPLAPLRFTTRTVHVAPDLAPDDLPGVVLSELRELVVGDEEPQLRAVGARVVVGGAHDDGAALAESAARNELRSAAVEERGRTVFVHDLRLEVRPTLDLDAWARRADPAGALARIVRSAEGPPGPERDALLRDARERVGAAAGRPAFADLPAAVELGDEAGNDGALDDGALDDGALARRVAEHALRALHVLAAQRRTEPS